MSFDFLLELLKLFLIGSGFGLVVGLLIFYKQYKKEKNVEKEDLEEEVKLN